ncbi:MAG TPA: hypothetical protein VK619_03390, partial [Pyrinomonadaceae bacterium]|nr:hypothetical protein [Pyrinomonadaceae bacterium]
TPGTRRPGTAPSLSVLTRLQTLFNVIQEVDAAPTPSVTAAVADVLRDSQTLIERWRTIQSQDIPALNRMLQDAGLPQVEAN